MRYHLDTIPVWEAFQADAACPICHYRIQTEALLTERALGASVMEPDTRIKANRLGFCARHQAMLYARENRLGHALLLQSHLNEIKGRIAALFDAEGKKPRPSLFAKKEQLLSGFDDLQHTCMLCDQLDESMGRFLYSMLHLYQSDAAFRTLYASSRGLCLYDLGPVLSMAREHLRGDTLARFHADTKALTLKALQKDIEDIDFFTRKFDYRNADLPWDDKRDAVERAVNFLRGACVGASSLPDQKEKKA